MHGFYTRERIDHVVRNHGGKGGRGTKSGAAANGITPTRHVQIWRPIVPDLKKLAELLRQQCTSYAAASAALQLSKGSGVHRWAHDDPPPMPRADKFLTATLHLGIHPYALCGLSSPGGDSAIAALAELARAQDLFDLSRLIRFLSSFSAEKRAQIIGYLMGQAEVLLQQQIPEDDSHEK